MLVEERERWRKEYEAGTKLNSPILNQYRANRNSELWRVSRAVEQLCEYVVYLERELHDKGK
jgi:hypothetical protein